MKVNNDLRIKAIQALGRPISLYRALPTPHIFHNSTARHRVIFGGNRSGKSESNIGYDLSTFALGIHPCRRTPVDAVIWAAADTWDEVGKLLWFEKLSHYLPRCQIKLPIVWHNKQREIPLEIRLKNGNRIEFKAYREGREAFQGRQIDAFYGDEQCSYHSEAIWIEIQARLAENAGFSSQSMTPILPQAWLEQKVVDGAAGYEFFFANLNDNRKSRGGYIDDAEIELLIAEWPIEVQATRIEGKFASFAGAVYKTWSREVHVCEPFKIPDEWPRWRSIDFGYNNPFVCLWLSRDPDGCWYVYNEYYLSRDILANHSAAIQRKSRSDHYSDTFADHDAQDRAELWEYGIETSPARKAVNRGIETVQRFLKVQGNGKPRLQVFNTCKYTCREMPALRYPEGTDIRDPKDESIKKDDHTCDALRYAIYSVEYDSPLITMVSDKPPRIIDPDSRAIEKPDMEIIEGDSDIDGDELERAGIWK